MKKILGNLIWLLLAIQPAVAVEDYFFKASLSKNELFAGEAGLLEVSFYKKREISTIIGKSRPEPNGAYRIEEFEVESDNDDIYAIDTFVYLLRFDKPGTFTVPLYGEIQKFNEQDIIDSNNHRDAMMAVAASQEKVFIKELRVTVFPAPKDVPVGSFRLVLTPDETTVLENEPFHFSVTIEGEGEIKEIDFPKIAVSGTELFVQEGERKRWLEKGSLMGKKVNHYALVSRESFTLPALEVSYFQPASKSLQHAATKAVSVEVRSDALYHPEALLDEETRVSRIPSFLSLEFLKALLLYGLIFVLGYLTAKIRLPKSWMKEESRLVRGIKKTATQKELLQLLLPFSHQASCREAIRRLEEEGEMDRRALRAVKKEILLMLKKWS